VSDERDQVEGQRRAIREHIEKYETLPERDKYTALRTIQNAQNQIQKLKSRKSSLGYSYEDDWRP